MEKALLALDGGIYFFLYLNPDQSRYNPDILWKLKILDHLPNFCDLSISVFFFFAYVEKKLWRM